MVYRTLINIWQQEIVFLTGKKLPYKFGRLIKIILYLQINYLWNIFLQQPCYYLQHHGDVVHYFLTITITNNRFVLYDSHFFIKIVYKINRLLQL